MSEVEKPLNKRQKELIVKYFLYEEDILRAHREVYPKCNEVSVLTEAYKKLKKLRGTSFFKAKEAEKLRKEQEFKEEIEEKLKIDREWLLEQNKKVYESAMEGDFIVTEAGGYTKLDRQAANKSLDQLTKMLGEYANPKDDESKARIAQLEKELAVLKTQKLTADTYLQALKALKE